MNAKSTDGRKVMHFATQTSAIETLQFFITRLGRGGIDTRVGEDFGHQTSLPMAAATGNARYFEFLPHNGDSISLECRAGSTVHCAMLAISNDVCHCWC